MIYFIYGEDSYRSKRKLDEIVEGYKKVRKSGLNLVYIDVKENNFTDLADNFKVVSMFSEKKLIILKNVFSSAKFQEGLLENLKDLEGLEDIIVIYEDNAPDQRTKLFKELLKRAKCQEFKPLQGRALQNWVDKEFEVRKAKIDLPAENLLLNFVGNNLWRMINEINKLSNYKTGSTIKREDVELLIRPNIENDIFKTIDALAAKDKKQALTLLYKHLEAGDNPLYLLSMISYQFRNLLITRELLDGQIPYGLMVKKSGLHPFVVQKSTYLCRQFPMEKLKKIYHKIFQIDSDIKTGRIEAEAALDLLVSEI